MLYRLFFGLIIFSSVFWLVFADAPTLDSIIINNTIIVNSWSSIEESKVEVLADELVILTWTYLNCGALSDPVIKWYKNNFVNVDQVWTWEAIEIQTSFNWNYFATLYCKGISFNSIAFSIKIKENIPIVDAWSNVSYISWDNVNLSWSINWTDPSCTTFDYLWEQISWPIVDITNSWQLLVNSKSYNNASFVFPDTTENIQLRLNVTPQSCANAWNTFSWSVTYSKKTWWWWRSYYSRMLDEANYLFSSSWSIDKISLNLSLIKNNYTPFIYFTWNNLWWDAHIVYTLEYSTWSNSESYFIYDTREKFYNLYDNLLDENSFIHYFRIKACYLWKCSHYSNVVKYYTEDYLKITCNNNIKLPKFDDSIDSYDLFIDDYYKVKCIKCSANKKENIEADENKLLELKYNTICNKCKFVDFKDANPSFLDVFYKTTCEKCLKINY